MRFTLTLIAFWFTASALAQNKLIDAKITNDKTIEIKTKEFDLTLRPIANNSNQLDFIEFTYFPQNNKEKWHHSYAITPEKSASFKQNGNVKIEH